jgi:biopolymer transport protein TolR
MARKTPLMSLKPISEINLTPLIDLTFLLLITFIITFPLVEQGIPVNLPKGSSSELSPDSAKTVTMDQAGTIFLNNSAVTIEQLAASMQAIGRDAPDTMIIVRADERLVYGNVVKILKCLHDAKISKMALVTEADER